MKKFWILPVVILLLTGCSAQETFETVADIYAVPVSVSAHTVSLSLPDEAVMPTMEAEDGSKLYLCEGYTVTVMTLEAGDLDRTLRETTGFGKDALTVMETRKDGFKRYSCAWSTTGEGMDQICRTVILDDGSCHYAVTVMADYTQAGDLDSTWDHILDSASLVSTG